MPKGIYKRTKRGKYKVIEKRIPDQIKKEIKRPNKFRRNVEDLRTFVKENDIKLLELLEYIRTGKRKKIKKGEVIDHGH